MFKIPSRILLAIAALGFVSCSTNVDMPKGTSKGYASARLIQRDPNLPAITNPTEKQVHGMIQKSLAKHFTSKGMAYGKGDADLIVAYMVIYQEPGMTADYDDYFGYGRDAGRDRRCSPTPAARWTTSVRTISARPASSSTSSTPAPTSWSIETLPRATWWSEPAHRPAPHASTPRWPGARRFLPMSQAAVGAFILSMPLVPDAGIQPESTVCRISDHPGNSTGNKTASPHQPLDRS